MNKRQQHGDDAINSALILQMNGMTKNAMEATLRK